MNILHILSASPVRCRHFTLGNPKSHLSTVLFIHTFIHTNNTQDINLAVGLWIEPGFWRDSGHWISAVGQVITQGVPKASCYARRSLPKRRPQTATPFRRNLLCRENCFRRKAICIGLPIKPHPGTENNNLETATQHRSSLRRFSALYNH